MLHNLYHIRVTLKPTLFIGARRRKWKAQGREGFPAVTSCLWSAHGRWTVQVCKIMIWRGLARRPKSSNWTCCDQSQQKWTRAGNTEEKWAAAAEGAPLYKLHQKKKKLVTGNKTAMWNMYKDIEDNNGILEKLNYSVVPSVLSFNKLIKYHYFNN